MKLYGISLCLALVVAVKASEDALGNCGLYFPVAAQGAKNSSIDAISSFGELAVVAFDPNADEAGFKCISMKFDSVKMEYSIKYKLADGSSEIKNGTYEVKTEEVDILFVGKVGRTFYDMPGLKNTNIFGNDRIYPIYVGKNEVILKGCAPKGLFDIAVSTYMLTTIAKAVENNGCNCPDWEAACIV